MPAPGLLGRNPFIVTAKTRARAAILKAALDPLGPAPATSPGYSALVDKLVSGDWGMDGNDSVGDCTCADPAHRLMIWSSQGAGKIVIPTADETLALYSAITGYNPSDPSTDQGSELPTVAAYLDSTGFTVGGQVYKEDGYGMIDPANVDHWKWAITLFGCCPIGISVQQAQMDQFNAGVPWDYVPGSPIVGRHDVLLVEYNPDGSAMLVTWGKRWPATAAFMDPKNGIVNECVPVVSHEFVTAAGTAPSGIDLTQMTADLQALN
jgi:hypothetical protein